MTVFTSKVWGMDFHHFLAGAFERKLRELNYSFDDAILFINNEVPEEVKFPCKTIRVEPYINEVLEFFKLDRDSFGKGFWYSIEELTELYLLKDFDCICHYSGDSVPTSGDWITQGIEILKSEPDVSVISPFSGVNNYHNQTGNDQEFSDQAYLIRVKEFRQNIYNYKLPEQHNYPQQSGHTFEYKCGQYLKNNNKYRRILNDHYYVHPQY